MTTSIVASKRAIPSMLRVRQPAHRAQSAVGAPRPGRVPPRAWWAGRGKARRRFRQPDLQRRRIGRRRRGWGGERHRAGHEVAQQTFPGASWTA